MIRLGLQDHQIHYALGPVKADFRAGDVRHSLADISKARALLGFQPTHTIKDGLRDALPWYIGQFAQKPSDEASPVPL